MSLSVGLPNCTEIPTKPGYLSKLPCCERPSSSGVPALENSALDRLHRPTRQRSTPSASSRNNKHPLRSMIRSIAKIVRRGVVNVLVRAWAVAETRYYSRAKTALPEHGFGHVRIYGSPMFMSSIAQSLSKLSEVYPYGYSVVRRYIRAVVQRDPSRGTGIFLGVVYRQWRINNGLPLPPDRVAAQLVRQAVEIRKVSGFSIWRSPRSELGSLYWELKAMKVLGCEAKHFEDVEEAIKMCRNRLIGDRPPLCRKPLTLRVECNEGAPPVSHSHRFDAAQAAESVS